MIDAAYFDKVSPESVASLNKDCQLLCFRLNALLDAERLDAEKSIHENRILNHSKQVTGENRLALLASVLAGGESDPNRSTGEFSEEYARQNELAAQINDRLKAFVQELDLSRYSYAEVAGFYLYLSLNRDLWKSLNACRASMQLIDWSNLNESRF